MSSKPASRKAYSLLDRPRYCGAVRRGLAVIPYFFSTCVDTNKKIRHKRCILHLFFTYLPTFYPSHFSRRHTYAAHDNGAYRLDSVCDTMPRRNDYCSGLGSVKSPAELGR